jgi:hypothetical protein
MKTAAATVGIHSSLEFSGFACNVAIHMTKGCLLLVYNERMSCILICSAAKSLHTDKKETKIFFIFKEIQMGSAAKSYKRKGFLKYEQMRKFFPIYEDAVSNI